MRSQPPKIPLRFLRWFCQPDLLKYIEGDLIELFEENVEQKGKRKARLHFTWEVLKLFRLGIIKSKRSITQINYWTMFKNHLKIALRVFKKEKFFTAVNVLGLACGVWCALLTFYWCMDEYSYDRFHEKGDHLYRIMMNLDLNGENYTDEGTVYPLGDILVEDFPEVKSRVRYSVDEPIAATLNGQLSEQSFASADPNFFEMFSIPLLEGDAQNCLQDKSNIVISKKLAEAYFKGESPVGKHISLHYESYRLEFLVSGVFEDFPQQSSIRFDMLIPIENLEAFYGEAMNDWGNTWFVTYIELDDQSDIGQFQQKIEKLPTDKAGMEWYDLTIQKFGDQYLFDQFKNGVQSGGRIDTLILFIIISGFTLLIASFNYVNITTARTIKRDKEVGIRKTIGASRTLLISQFLTESGLIVLIAMILGVGVAWITLPYFNAMTGKSVFVDLTDVNFYVLLGGVYLVTLSISGVYPSISLSRANRLYVLKSSNENKRSSFVRKGLVALQFSISIMIIGGTVIIYQQLSYIMTKDLGLQKENVLFLELDQQSKPKFREIKNVFEESTSVKGVGVSNHDFIGAIGYTGDVNWRLKQEGAEHFIAVQSVEAGMLDLLNIQLQKGAFFSSATHPDSTQFIINEAAASLLGFENPIGESLEFWGKRGTIIGVTKDFHFSTLHEQINPLVIRNVSEPNYLFVKTQAGKSNEVVELIDRVHSEFSSLPVNMHFLDREIEAKYTDERTLQKLAYCFAVLALIICALGLMGLVSYSIDTRIKEIAVRKVLGASLINLGQLLFKEYLWLMLVAAVIGVPVFLKWSGDWLESYPYRIEVSPGVI
ncbi:MAG: hypothetical protein CMB89_05085, partial [Flammeovirgaceae bacterium]|nr:hypothetical protein [Flammeovirgaceae bacterium]